MKILVVEDNLELLRVLEEALEEEGFEVDGTASGREGLQMALAGGYDCIVLDLMLPDMDGFELCRKVRLNKVETPILMLTAKDAVEDRVRGLSLGADDYLVKPFDIRELVARIWALLRRSSKGGSPGGSYLECGPIRLYLNEMELRIGGKLVVFRPREVEILKILMLNKNKVVPKAEIERILRGEQETKSNVVDVHVKFLRDKLKAFGLEGMIKTVRGVGYQLLCGEDEEGA